MRMVERMGRRLRVLLGRARFEREMSEEMRHHLEMEIRDRIEAGMSPAEARRTARRDFGGEERWKESARAARGLAVWDGVSQDLRYATRSLLGAPGFALVSVATLAAGIGAATAVFSVVDGLLLRPLDYPQPDRLVRLVQVQDDGGGFGTISSANFYDWMARATVFEGGALYDEYRPTLVVGEQAVKVDAASVSASYFEVLGVSPLLGRFFRPEEEEGGAARVVLSQELWRDAFGADPTVAGRSIELNGFPYTVVGVAPAMEDPGLSGVLGEVPRLWRSPPSYFATNSRGALSFTAVARLRAGVPLERASAELATIHAALTQEYPEENRGRGVVRVVPLLDDMVGGVRPILLVLLASVGLVLVIACANVANLLLFRGASRGHEMGLRAALGAPRSRVVRQLLLESVLLALGGALLGVLLAMGAVRGLLVIAAGQIPRITNVSVDLRVLAFAVTASLGAVLVFGLVPALHTARRDLRGVLGEARGAAPGSRSRLRSAVVALQVALAVLVMLGAGLLGRSLLTLQGVDPGLAVEGTLVLRTDPPADPYDPSGEDGPAPLLALYSAWEERLRALPGVAAVGMTDLLPLSGSFNGNAFRVVGRPEPPLGEVPSVETRAVSAGYLPTMEVPLLAGRLLLPSDDAAAERVLVVSESFAQRNFPEGDVLGARLEILDRDLPPARIVGVVGDVAQFGLDLGPEPSVYLALAQAPSWMQGQPWIVLRSSGDPEAVLASARAAVQEVEPRAPVYLAGSMEGVVARTLARPRFRTTVLLVFAFVSFLLSATGVYGMVAYSVAGRTAELGVRMALGADARRLAREVTGEGLRPVLLGAASGVAAGLLAARLLGGLLYGISPLDPVTFLAVPALLLGVGALAGWLPARRAARLSPSTVLRRG